MIKELATRAALELADTVSKVDDNQLNELMSAIEKAQSIFFVGAGRSLLMLRGFAMRLMHLGYESYVVGDTTTPAFTDKDLLIIGSGSGETGTLISVGTKAKKIGGKIALITIRDKSTLAGLADTLVIIPAFTDKVDDPSMIKPLLPGGTLFEESLLLIADTLVLPLAEKNKVSTSEAFIRHANLE